MNDALVSLRNVSLTIGWKRVLEGINLSLHAGEVVGLIGPGGSGKTQLIRVMSTLAIPRKGEVRLFGGRVTASNRKWLREVRSRIGLQFQNFALFDFLDVRGNVGFSLEHMPEERRRGKLFWVMPKKEGEAAANSVRHKKHNQLVRMRVDEALESVGLSEFADAWPVELSGGMRRRVAIARVTAARPELAIFDDPVAGLDPVNSAKIMVLLEQYARTSGSLVVIATHDMERLLPICTRVVAIFNGRILFDGPTSALPHAESQAVRDFVAAATEGWKGKLGGEPT